MYVFSNKPYFLNKDLGSVFMHLCSTHKALLPTTLPEAEPAALLKPELPPILPSAELISCIYSPFSAMQIRDGYWGAKPLDKSPLRYISISAHLQGKQFLWFSTELRLGCQFEARVQHTGRLLIPQAASAWAGPALICVDVNLRWLSWSHYCYSGFTLGRKQEQELSQDHNISRSICPLYI